MPDKPYQFVLIRYRPSLVRGERINIGLLMWIPEEERFDFLLEHHWNRVLGTFPKTDRVAYFALWIGLQDRLQHLKEGSLDLSFVEGLKEKIHAVLGGANGCFPASHLMSGLTASHEKRLQELYEELVL